MDEKTIDKDYINELIKQKKRIYYKIQTKKAELKVIYARLDEIREIEPQADDRNCL